MAFPLESYLQQNEQHPSRTRRLLRTIRLTALAAGLAIGALSCASTKSEGPEPVVADQTATETIETVGEQAT